MSAPEKVLNFFAPERETRPTLENIRRAAVSLYFQDGFAAAKMFTGCISGTDHIWGQLYDEWLWRRIGKELDDLVDNGPKPAEAERYAFMDESE